MLLWRVMDLQLVGSRACVLKPPVAKKCRGSGIHAARCLGDVGLRQPLLRAADSQANKALETRLGPGGQEDALKRQPMTALANGPRRISPAPVARPTAPQPAFAAAGAANRPAGVPMVRKRCFSSKSPLLGPHCVQQTCEHCQAPAISMIVGCTALGRDYAVSV